jgi:fructose-1,6-bisphosphatase/inositol monophosphatase family enzyme
MNNDFKIELEFAKNLAIQAGEKIRLNFGFEKNAEWKEDNTPLTSTDIEVNKYVIEAIKVAFPSDGVLGEEDSYEISRKRLWVVDPIDGTQPYDLGAPLSTFCISLVINGKPVVGVIYDPFMKNIFYAQIGKGAFLNSQKISVNNESNLEHNYIILSSRMPDTPKSTGEIHDAIEAVKSKAFNFRSFAYGSTFVAAGSAVGAIIGAGNPWDAAASKIIVEEAGGKVTDVHGRERRYDSPGPGLVVSNGILHETIIKLLS